MDRNNNSIMNRIYQGSWKDALPPNSQRIGVDTPLENSGHSWIDVWEKQKNYSDIAESIGKIMGKDRTAKAFPLEVLHSYFDSLENWVAINGNVLTFPPTQDAWDKAVKATVEKKDLDMVLILSSLAPKNFKELMKTIDLENNVTKWFKTAKGIADTDASKNNIIEEKKLLEESLKPEPQIPSLEKKEENKFIPTKDYILTEQENRCFEWLKPIIEDVQLKNLPVGVAQNNMDDNVKKKKLNDGDFFFDIELFGAIIKLNKEELVTLATVWPEHQKIAVYDSLAFLSSPKFWKGLNSTKENKDFIIENVLPLMLDISKLPFSNKYQIGKEILQYTTKSSDLFMQRLNLWLNIGGDLMEKPTIAVNFSDDFGDDFESLPMPKEEAPNLLNWIINQKNDMWTTEVHNLLDKKGFKIESIDNAFNELNKQKQSMKL